MADYYQVLGISKNASAAEIKSAYRKKALEWHPDRNKSTGAAEKFKEVNKAYEVLADPKKKEMYDQYGSDAFERGGGFPGAGQTSYQEGPFSYTYRSYGGEGNPFGDVSDFSDPFEIFEQFFGFRSPFGGRSTRSKPRDAYQIQLTFDEAVHGTEKETVIKGKTKKIKIPAGVDDNNQIRFADFDLVVRVKPHQYFKRQGQDIYLEKEISFTDATLGTVAEVETINQPVKLRVRPGTQSGTTVRLQGQGVPYPNTNRKGDEYVVFSIKVPAKVSSRAKKLLEELDTELK